MLANNASDGIGAKVLDALLSHGAPLLRGQQSRFRDAKPFPHIAVDNILPTWIMDALDAEFPDAQADACSRMGRRRGWHCTMHGPKLGGWLKLGTADETKMGPTVVAVMQALKSDEWREHIANLTGIGPLASDPMNSGAGLHQIFPNGSLQLHADNNHMHDRDPAATAMGRSECSKHYCAERRVNLFLYLNANWRTAWGGDLELWDRGLTRCETRIAPLRNRLVAFASTDFSFHGHPNPLGCPEGRTRRSLAVYYYTIGGASSLPLDSLNLTARRNGWTTLYREAADGGVCSAAHVETAEAAEEADAAAAAAATVGDPNGKWVPGVTQRGRQHETKHVEPRRAAIGGGGQRIGGPPAPPARPHTPPHAHGRPLSGVLLDTFG